MNPNQTILRQHSERIFPRPLPFDSTSDCLTRTSGPEQLPEFNCRITPRKICGQLLSVHGDVELPVEHARVEVYSVMPLKRVTNELPNRVLAHCRTLLLEAAHPIDIYRPSKHIADAPLLSFADVQNLREIPGYERLASAARSQDDASFRQLLGSNPVIARLLLCYYHPASFPVVHTANAVTNEVGCFQTTVLESGNAEDRPGYLFVARHKISSCLYITLYNPTPATWYTYWDLPENKAVVLRTRHPLALQGHSKQ